MDSNIFDRLISNSRNNIYPKICKTIVEHISHEANMSATHIIEKAFDLLPASCQTSTKYSDIDYPWDDLNFLEEVYNLPGFNPGPGSASLTSEGMLASNHAIDVVCDILKPNLYCALLMEMIGKTVPVPISLNKLKDKYYQSLDDTQQVKTLPKLIMTTASSGGIKLALKGPITGPPKRRCRKPCYWLPLKAVDWLAGLLVWIPQPVCECIP